MCVDAHVVNDLGMGQDERAIWPGGGCGCADQPTTFDAALMYYCSVLKGQTATALSQAGPCDTDGLAGQAPK